MDIILVIVLLAVVYNSPSAIFFPSISSVETTQQVLSAYAAEFQADVNLELGQTAELRFHSRKISL